MSACPDCRPSAHNEGRLWRRTLFVMSAKALLSLARWTQPSYVKLAATRGRAQLLTIPYSHYCELGKWSLSAANIPYDEQPFAPGMHVLPLLSLRLGGHDRHISHSSAVTAVPAADAIPSTSGTKSHRPHHATAVPACCMPDGRVLVDSWAIVSESAAALGLPPPDAKLQTLLDEQIGPLVRQALYDIIFRPVNRAAWDGLVTSEGGAAWSLAWRLGVGQRLTDSMVHLFRSADPDATALGRERLREALAALERDHLGPALLAAACDAGGGGHGGFMGGRRPGLSDVALAAICSPLAMPPLYAEGKYAEWFDLVLANDAEARAEVEHFRATPVGQHCLKVYEHARVDWP